MKTATVWLLVALITTNMNIACALSSKELVKPGACPISALIPAKNCADRCSGDQSCPKIKKCCPTVCGHICIIPIFQVSIFLCFTFPLL
uniref:WAP domain-containing protein n=1 Tax=Mus spicilegus TaxID=10103 RepID=A0A8C6H2Q3_MUSSI